MFGMVSPRSALLGAGTLALAAFLAAPYMARAATYAGPAHVARAHHGRARSHVAPTLALGRREDYRMRSSTMMTDDFASWPAQVRIR